MKSTTDHAPRHSWNATDPKRIAVCDSFDGNDRTEKTCPACGMVKITVHPARGLPWREWRTKGGKVWVGDTTPPGIGAKPELQVASESATEVVFSG
jgi:hypothetical protein